MPKVVFCHILVTVLYKIYLVMLSKCYKNLNRIFFFRYCPGLCVRSRLHLS